MELPLSSPPATEKTQPVLSLIMDEPPGARPIVRQPVWPGKLTDEWPATGNVPFELGISRAGQPEYCMPLSPGTAPAGVDLEVLRRTLMDVRFSGVTGGPQWQWISVAVRW
jgi:hypothetical protein